MFPKPPGQATKLLAAFKEMHFTNGKIVELKTEFRGLVVRLGVVSDGSTILALYLFPPASTAHGRASINLGTSRNHDRSHLLSFLFPL